MDIIVVATGKTLRDAIDILAPQFKKAEEYRSAIMTLNTYFATIPESVNVVIQSMLGPVRTKFQPTGNFTQATNTWCEFFQKYNLAVVPTPFHNDYITLDLAALKRDYPQEFAKFISYMSVRIKKIGNTLSVVPSHVNLCKYVGSGYHMQTIDGVDSVQPNVRQFPNGIKYDVMYILPCGLIIMNNCKYASLLLAYESQKIKAKYKTYLYNIHTNYAVEIQIRTGNHKSLIDDHGQEYNEDIDANITGWSELTSHYGYYNLL